MQVNIKRVLQLRLPYLQNPLPMLVGISIVISLRKPPHNLSSRTLLC